MSDPEQKGTVDPTRFAAEFDHRFRTEEKAPRVDLAGIDPNIHKEIALELIKQGHAAAVIEGLNRFKEVDHKELISKFIDSGAHHTLCGNIHSIDPNIDRIDIASEIIEKGFAHSVCSYLDNFPDSMHPEIFQKLMDAQEYHQIAVHLDHFKQIDYGDAVAKLRQVGAGDEVEKWQKER